MWIAEEKVRKNMNRFEYDNHFILTKKISFFKREETILDNTTVMEFCDDDRVLKINISQIDSPMVKEKAVRVEWVVPYLPIPNIRPSIVRLYGRLYKIQHNGGYYREYDLETGEILYEKKSYINNFLTVPYDVEDEFCKFIETKFPIVREGPVI